MKDEILEIAALSRRACEQYNEVYPHFPNDLNGMCGIASHFLFCNLEDRGYKPTFIMTYHDPMGAHCWVVVNELNIDITATQFGIYSPIYNFCGIMKSHPVLKKRYGGISASIFDEAFPENWHFRIAKSEMGIDRLMNEWPAESVYSGKVRKRLDNFYR